MDNNGVIGACVVSGIGDGSIKIEDGKAMNTELVHKELNERMSGIETIDEAKEFSKETGAQYYISGQVRENEKQPDISNEKSYHSNSRNKEVDMGR